MTEKQQQLPSNRLGQVRHLDYPERAPSRGARSEMGDIGPRGGLGFYRPHFSQQHFYDPRSFYSASR
ncbi:unnamed protein product [Enterobius vermicularis]|uniref:Uncharacterized protein n=1 Tax=Enterobius vermicularis TaxID=51028 RepID=A0A0N4V1P4_ENTVE|nr:unnamed protein product [Enterobius vermicularis]